MTKSPCPARRTAAKVVTFVQTRGAIAEGDIGDHFPDTDSKNLNLDSSFIVKDAIKIQVVKVVENKSFF